MARFNEDTMFTIPLESHGVHPDTQREMMSCVRMVIPKGTNRRKARREFRKLMDAYGVADYNKVIKEMGFDELR